MIQCLFKRMNEWFEFECMACAHSLEYLFSYKNENRLTFDMLELYKKKKRINIYEQMTMSYNSKWWIGWFGMCHENFLIWYSN